MSIGGGGCPLTDFALGRSVIGLTGPITTTDHVPDLFFPHKQFSIFALKDTARTHFSKILSQWHLKRDEKNMSNEKQELLKPSKLASFPLFTTFFLKAAELLSDWMENMKLCHAVETKCRQKAAQKTSSTHE